MATWKKVIVSGSTANLANLQVDGLTSGEVVIGGGSGNLSTTAVNGTGNIVATTNATNLVHSGSFSGSFQGNGSGLTGVVATLGSSLTQGTGITTFTFDGSSAQTVSVSGSSGLTSNTVTKWTGNAFANTSITDNGSLVTFTNNALFQGNVTVQGTASFQNTENLLVADRFVLFASGSNTTGDGGIVIQQGTQNIGEFFGYDAGTVRWGLTSSFDAATSTFAPDAFVAAVVDLNAGHTDVARYQKNGNIKVDTNGDIFIYA